MGAGAGAEGGAGAAVDGEAGEDDAGWGLGGAEVGDQGDALAGGDQGQDGGEVVDLVPDPGGEARGLAGADGHGVAERAGRGHDPRRAVLLRDRARGAGCQVHGLGEDRAGHAEAGLRLGRDEVVLVHQRDVQLARAQCRADGRRVHLGDHRLQPRVPAGQFGEQRRDDRAGRRGVGADPQRAGQPLLGVGEFGVGLLQQGDHRLGVPDQAETGRGEGDPPAGAFQQRDAGLLLQDGQLLGHRRRAEGQRLGDGRDGAEVGKFAQQAQASDVEHRLSLREASEM